MRLPHLVSTMILGSVLTSLLVPGGAVLAKRTTTSTPTNSASGTTTTSGTTLNGTYVVQSGDSFFTISQKTGYTVDALKQANGMTTDTIYPGQTLTLPRASSSGQSTTSGTTYTVQSGDTLYLISVRYGVTVDALRQANPTVSDSIYPGQILVIPSKTSGQTGTSPTTVTVQSGDSLYLIAARYGTTVDALKQVNGLTSDTVYVGQTLKLSTTSTTTPAPTPAPSPTPTPSGTTYTVQPGDSLYFISVRFGITVDALKSANNLTSDVIYAGLVLSIPSATQTPSPTPTPDPTPTPTPTPDPSPTPAAGQIIEPGVTETNAVTGSAYVLTKDDYDLLARLVSAEAQGEPYDGQVAVAASVLHRMGDSRFPATIHDIIYQVYNTYYYQFSTVENGAINDPAVPSAYKAVTDAINGIDPSIGAKGFYNPAGTENTWIKQQTVTVIINNHVFYRF